MTASRRPARALRDAVVRIECRGRAGINTGFLRDLAPGGMFLRIIDPEAAGRRVEFTLALGGGRSVRGSGEVAWCRPSYEGPGRPPGMAVRFLSIAPSSRQVLADAIGAPLAPHLDPADDEPPDEVADTPEEAAESTAVGIGPAGETGVEGADGVFFDLPDLPGLPVPSGVASGVDGGAGDDAAAAVAGSAETAADAIADSAGPKPTVPRRGVLVLVGVGLAAAAAILGGFLWMSPAERLAGDPAAPVEAGGQRSASAAQPEPAIAPPPADGSEARRFVAEAADAVDAGAEAVPAGGREIGPMTRLVDVSWEVGPGITLIRIRGDGALAPERLRWSLIGDPQPRLVLEIGGLAGPTEPRRWTLETPEVATVRSGFHPSAGGLGALHLVLDLESAEVAVDVVESDEAGVALRLSRPST